MPMLALWISWIIRDPPLPGSQGPQGLHDFVCHFFVVFVWSAFCSPTNHICLTLGLKIGSFGLPFCRTVGCFLATFSDQAMFGESCSRAGESSKNKVAGSPKLHNTLIKSDLACGPVLGHIFLKTNANIH